MNEMRDEMRTSHHTPRPTRRVDDAEVVTLGRARVGVAAHAGPHARPPLPVRPEHGVVLSGDHVLPTITPAHRRDRRHRRRPAGGVLPRPRSHGGLPDVTVALPAHGHPFDDLAKRVNEIEEHHNGRLHRLRDASEELGRPAPVHEMMQHLFSERAWGSMAESETYAHLEHLRLSDEAEVELVRRPAPLRPGRQPHGRPRLGVSLGRPCSVSPLKSSTTEVVTRTRAGGWLLSVLACPRPAVSTEDRDPTTRRTRPPPVVQSSSNSSPSR